MKKILGLLSVAAMMLIACDEENGGNGQDPADYNYSEPRVAAAPNQADHFGMSVDQTKPQDGMKTPEGQVEKTTEVNVPPGNSGTVQFTDGKPPREFNYTVSKVAAGTTFITDKVFKQLEISSVEDGSVVLKATMPDNKVVELSGQFIPEPAYTPYRQDVCRTWVVEETLLAITVDGKSILGVGGKFNGCKLSKISEKLSEKGVNVTVLPSDYDVTKIMIDPCGKFGIFFQGRDPYYGNYTLKGTEFTYDFTYYEGQGDDNPVIAGSATGKLWAINGYGRLNLKSDMADKSGKKYTVDITLKMKTAK